jgi:hypothetical protein
MNAKGNSLIVPVGEELPAAEPGPAAPPKTGARRKKGRALRRFHQINQFCDETLQGLGRVELAVWLLLWRDTKPNGLARVSQMDLARRAGCTDRSVRRALATLESRGLVKTVHQGGIPRRLSTYRVAAVATGERRDEPDG